MSNRSMALQAFIDESYAPGGVFVLGGYVSSAERWAKFSREWERGLRRFGVLDHKANSYHFKYNQMASNPERRERNKIFENIVHEHAMFGIFCRIKTNDVVNAVRRIQIPAAQSVDFGRLQNPYHVAFRCMMDKFHSSRSEFPEIVPATEPIDFFFDEQVGEQRAIMGFWDEYICNRSDNVRNLYGRKPVFGDDKQFLPLQAADLLAGLVRETSVRGNFADAFAKDTADNKSFPVFGIEFNEDHLADTFAKIVRDQVDAQVFDVKWGSVLV